jgi:GT2 family glycosyltransferase
MAKKRRPQRMAPIQDDARYDVDIVIPVHGQAELLRKCLAALGMAAFNTKYKVILVDDSSPESERASLDLLFNEHVAFPNVRIHQGKGKNQGFSWACNTGATLGESPAILFLNSDCILDAGAIDAMVSALNAPAPEIGLSVGDGKVGIVGAKLRFPDDSTDASRPAGKVQHAGISFDMEGNPHHVHLGWSPDHLSVNVPTCMQAVTGACLMIRRDLFSSVWANYRANGENTNGAFNNIYGLGTFEDMELCFAARHQGFNVVYEPRAHGTHYTGASVIQTGQQYPLNRNAGIFRARCGSMIVWDEFMLY